MSVKIKYNNKTTNVPAGKTATLACVNKTMVSNVEVTVPSGMIVPSGTEDITANGTHDVRSKASVKVQVPIPKGYIKPTGTKSINTLGETDVTEYAKVNVSLPEGYVKPEEEIEITQNGTYNTVNVKKAIVNLTLDPYDAFWDTYQNNGQRTDYSCAFAGKGWNNKTFKPKYDIVPTSASRIFSHTGIQDLKQALENAKIKFDFSKTTSCSYFADDNASVQRLPVIDTSSLKSLQYFLFSCPNLEYVEKIILKQDGTQTFTSLYSFGSCSKLRDIIFEGTIGTNNFNLSSPELSKNSIISVVNALSGTTSGLTATLSLQAVNTAFCPENMFKLKKGYNTSGSSVTNTICVATSTPGVVCGYAEVQPNTEYIMKRNINGKEYRYFFYDEWPFDTNDVYSTGGAYVDKNYKYASFTTGANTKYVVIRAAEGLTEAEEASFTFIFGKPGSDSTDWKNLRQTKPNWTISLV